MINSVELIGYISSIFVIASFCMKDIKLLRVMSIISCVMFIVYTMNTYKQIPMIITNVSVILINLYQLKRKI